MFENRNINWSTIGGNDSYNNNNMMNNNMMNNNMMNNNMMNNNIMNNMNVMNNFNNMNNMNNMNNINMFNLANINPMTFKLMLNFMLMMNPNINTNNQNNVNNMMMNFMNANPFVYQLFMNYQKNNVNNMANNINNNNNNNNNHNNIDIIDKSKEYEKKAEKGGIIPRPNNFSGRSAYDPFAGNPNLRIPILFFTGTGLKITINVPINVSIKDLFIGFIQKMGLDKSVIGKFIYFLYNGQKMDVNDQQSVNDFGLKTTDVIIVVDTSNLLGGKN